MAPRVHGGHNDGSDGTTDVSSSSASASASTTDSVVSTSTTSPTPTALFNTNAASSSSSSSSSLIATSTNPAVAINAAPTSASSSSQSPTSFKVIGGIVAALIGILIIFGVAIFYLKKRWKAKEQREATRAVFDAKGQHDEEGGEGTAFIRDVKHEEHSRESSLASTRSKNSVDSYLKTGRKRSSMGTQYNPGVAPEEAYMMFGGSTTNLNDEDEQKPLSYHERHLSESAGGGKRMSWSGAPPTTDPRARKTSLLDEESRYPVINPSTDSVNRKQMRHSVSYPPGVVDPFADAIPTASPQLRDRASTSSDVRNPTGTRPLVASPPAGAQAPINPAEGRRVSLKGGVGVRRKSSVTGPGGSPGGSPKIAPGSPRAAWK